MTDFNDRCTTAFTVDASKRVKPSYGLVLGVGEYQAEQCYFLEKHRRHARALHGYGTIAGLAVSVRDTAGGPEIRVSPGLAIDPHGRDICVPETQCALLNDWLRQRQEAGDLPLPPAGSPPERLSTHVVLCYRECETDQVPIPVGPCQSLDETTVASRIQDAFELRLSDSPPAQIEVEAMRDLAAILARVSIGTGPDALTTADALVAEIRTLGPAASPPEAGPSLPLDFLLHPDFAADTLRTALRVFITEVRPLLVPEGGGCLNGPADETCVLLARLDFDVDSVGGEPQITGDVEILEEDRPLLLPGGLHDTAWLLSAGTPQAAAADVTTVPSSATMLLGPALAEATNSRSGRAAAGNGLPALRFRRNGAATFGFAPPPDWRTDVPAELRLHWAHTGDASGAPPLQWLAILRLIESGDALSLPISETPPRSLFETISERIGIVIPADIVPSRLPAAATRLSVSVDAAAHDQLLTTETASLPIPEATGALLGALDVWLTSATSIPTDLSIFLVSAELTYRRRGGLS
jgi:hypothetical protein